ncbi:DUF4276 family protein [Polyangium sp. 6x1]|uniref:DUF4276 family protein n=1 Tax=Polyangium sp. 6x1 TaxID=3042689 RepID=UPI0024823EA0|nr:DUF4276 family protein [Polyangium sp. 6x1]MDI1446741.1 DUF4276 family protein [Polyangium sp. 6x1]
MVKKPSASKPTSIRIYIEGGGSSSSGQRQLRNGFLELFEREIAPRSLTVVACGGRNAAYKDFRLALTHHPEALCLLLVDSEESIAMGVSAWAHVQQRKEDQWSKPPAATDDHLHFMVQAMEAWLLADPQALARYYGKDFQPSALPARQNIENIPKQDLKSILKHASRNTKKAGYDETHGFALIGLIDPAKVRAASPWAARFFDHLLTLCPAR